jgi:Uma2 family endonuclease
MAPTTLLKRPRKPKTRELDSVELPEEEDRSASFFMPVGSMTLDDFRKWTSSDDFPETGKIAYMGEEVFIDMSPERIDSHGAVKVEVCTTVHALVRKKKKGRMFFDRTRIVNVSAVVSNEPDAFLATYETLKKGSLRRVQTSNGDDYIEFEGTPDWILEIVSPSSVSKDKKKLRKRYHRAGIAEYWLVDARGDDVDFQILIHGKDDYEPAERSGDWQVSKVFGKKFRLRRIKDELGDIDYRLDVK